MQGASQGEMCGVRREKRHEGRRDQRRPARQRSESINFCATCYVAYFFGGAFLTNAIPHFVSGSCGMPFQSPFAHPSGEGLSSSTFNVLWGFFNLVVGYLLVYRLSRCPGFASSRQT